MTTVEELRAKSDKAEKTLTSHYPCADRKCGKAGRPSMCTEGERVYSAYMRALRAYLNAKEQ